MPKDIKKMYKTIMDDNFPSKMEISFVEKNKRQTLFYEKVSWVIDKVNKGLRYGENPGQMAAMYKLVNGNLLLSDARTIEHGKYLVSDIQLLQSGKHPGKTNLTDADNALNILRYFSDTPCVVIVKHNNPCGVAKDKSLEQAYLKAYMADRVAAFGGCIAINKALDKATAQAIASQYAEVIVAPEFEEGTLDILKQRKNLRVIQINNIYKLKNFIGERVVDFKSLMDGAIVAQWSFVPKTLSRKNLTLASSEHKNKIYSINRTPKPCEYEDMLFGWLVESGITSNSIIYVKDGVTIGIGTGEQDRVGVAQIAIDKAYRKLADKYCFERHNIGFADLTDKDKKAQIEKDVQKNKGNLIGSAMISDAFFPFRDGVDVGLKHGVQAIIQPGGSLNDYHSIQACNENNATMVYTGQRSFKH